MNDGQDWRDMRFWMVNTLKGFGFGKRTMAEMIKDELLVVRDQLKTGGVRQMKPVIAPAVINVLWSLTTGKRFCDGQRYVRLFHADFSALKKIIVASSLWNYLSLCNCLLLLLLQKESLVCMHRNVIPNLR